MLKGHLCICRSQVDRSRLGRLRGDVGTRRHYRYISGRPEREILPNQRRPSKCCFRHRAECRGAHLEPALAIEEITQHRICYLFSITSGPILFYVYSLWTQSVFWLSVADPGDFCRIRHRGPDLNPEPDPDP